MAIFGRIVTAMVTPFNDKGQIDWDRTEKLINYLIDTGSEALVVSGTTGESPTLSKQEKLDLFTFSVQKANGRVKVIAGTGCNDTEETIAFTKEATKTGIDAIMLVAPYYSRTSQEGLYQHFKAISEAVELPIMLYNVPGRTGINVTADTTLRLAELPNVVCIKEASGNLTQMAQIIERAPQGFELYSGDDGLTIPVLSIGGVGVVSVTSHVIGLEMKEMMDAFFKGDTSRAAALHRKLVPIFEGAFKYPNPTPIKAALNKKGIEVGGVRLPLVELTDEEASYIDEWL
ncbi:4-hydroxy-tetrahydrodipicolinate synthase [Brevibacillus laterosporus]|uniref:4-hydroxy-tetrahydrodipicolinate synthase n=1 Tax=Brevibacillus laterosporus LMG 15441 TaxID=1042163 RepID=A0A075R4S1_BRELA|nr:4-hydroxy-tetrahydrodipicolinate synthase [Brevibacillus laterosporus]WPS86512.1 4-hydroxy-tetrahydrodipicolinate synthase [Brevibacillus halotolerans]HAS00791.1 4-hydroxy-tetrahydrodipicolinate synthase [Brevibacillus sp.]AIG27552.1 4-hydroxy-tetrahydrodipicolinate synthase [Brevibacillus laterosporus LMG 15441]ERM19547.1 dihydrodipicolinate synthase [Brevibacillus laterosporus PE36]MCR8994809.1 4-hydroxy-tetrahydrodipicolinate synthase [Brevibacillus laterosporus]